ncbi:STAS domain-containing protein (plasmid) [Streptomyces sp. NBC_01218]|uniref:STAS domain-containing protein n=1 Tax=Streptomyces sp. NBC_01218 TaxID=2903780 RepID=UPI002E154814|nr:STAS domain-containing protein [Streptomyces sp. NBC_01218]
MSESSDIAVSGRLTAHETRTDTTSVITLVGEIDDDTGDLLRQALAAPREAGLHHIVADLGEVTFMDSTGINIFLTAHQSAHADGGWLRLAGAGVGVVRMLRIVGVDSVISLHPDVPAALND